MATLDEIGNLLEAEGLGTQGGSGGTIFLGTRPDDPDVLLAVYEYPGGNPEYVQDQIYPINESVQLQVVARGVPGDYAGPSILCSRAWRVLAGITNRTLSGTYYRSIRPNNSPAQMGRDTNDRVLVYFNATAEKEVSLVS